MDLSELTEPIRTIGSVVIVVQLIGAVATFKPMRDRRVGLGSLFMFGYAAVMVGCRMSPLFLPAVIPGGLGLVAGVALFFWARVTIRDLFFSYINSRDVPQFVCSTGPYRWVRHPFYSSYLSSLLSMTVMFPNPVTFAGSILAFLSFNSAARFEESKFEGSPVAEEYTAYIQRTGRFIPRFGR